MKRLLETFTASDKEGNSYVVNVYGVEHPSIQKGVSVVKDYSLAATDEVLSIEKKAPLILKIKSTGVLIVNPSQP